LYLSKAADINLGVEITEIMYDTPGSYDSGGEWIEIYNDTSSALDISDWEVYDGTNWDSISQVSGYGNITNIPAGSYAVICEAASTYDFVDLYDGNPFPDFPNSRYLGRASGGIELSAASGGDNIGLRDDSGIPVVYQDFTYPDNATDAALVKIVIRSNEDTGSNWKQATTASGSPGIEGEDQSLPVGLSSFIAIYTDSGLLLKWTTETEIDHLGWNIYRSEEKDGEFVKVNDGLIEGAGNSAMPLDYKYVDNTTEPGKEYYYYIEDLDIFGETNKSQVISTTRASEKRLSTTWASLKKER
jgi:hypothetical protein